MPKLTKDEIHRARILMGLTDHVSNTLMRTVEGPDELAFMMMGLGLELAAHMDPEEVSAYAATFRKSNALLELSDGTVPNGEYDEQKERAASAYTDIIVEGLREQMRLADHEGECMPDHGAMN